MERYWTVGELAERTGLTVRTLHYYDEIGLCSPARRSEAGYRLYGAGDIARLQQVVSLRQLGFSLEEIRDCLDRPDVSPTRLLHFHISRLEERIDRQRRLRGRLQAIAERLDSEEEVSTETLIRTIEEIRMLEEHYTPEQLGALSQRREELGEERIREVEAEWPKLISEVREEMEAGTDPADDRVQELARRWMGLVREFTGGDPEIRESLNSLYRNDGPALREEHGDSVPDPEMFEYISRATARNP